MFMGYVHGGDAGNLRVSACLILFSFLRSFFFDGSSIFPLVPELVPVLLFCPDSNNDIIFFLL